ncbi:MAG: metal-dependent hydrolase [Thermoanaerobaculia bacterium]|nr:metal-dependent hydrolase [Thermoanaerobaculia bacterium]
MPTIFTHPVVALSGSCFFRRRPSIGLLVAGAACTVLPDLDVAAFYFGIPYEHPLGHRGVTHSLLFALLLGLAAAWLWRRFFEPRRPFASLATFFVLATASHGILDAFTNGGRGVGFFIPFDNARYFFPWRPIQVSPIGASGFFERGWPALASELWWVWLPALGLACVGRIVSSRRTGLLGTTSASRKRSGGTSDLASRSK